MNNEISDDVLESKIDLVNNHLLPGYNFKYTKFAIPANIQGQINAIHTALVILHERLKGEDQTLVSHCGSFIEQLEEDLKNYRIEEQELHL